MQMDGMRHRHHHAHAAHSSSPIPPMPMPSPIDPCALEMRIFWMVLTGIFSISITHIHLKKTCHSVEATYGPCWRQSGQARSGFDTSRSVNSRILTILCGSFGDSLTFPAIWKATVGKTAPWANLAPHHAASAHAAPSPAHPHATHAAHMGHAHIRDYAAIRSVPGLRPLKSTHNSTRSAGASMMYG